MAAGVDGRAGDVGAGVFLVLRCRPAAWVPVAVPWVVAGEALVWALVAGMVRVQPVTMRSGSVRCRPPALPVLPGGGEDLGVSVGVAQLVLSAMPLRVSPAWTV